MNDFDESLLPTQILAVLPTPVLVKNDALEYVWVNEAFESLFSVKKEELIGRTDVDIFPDRMAVQCSAGDLRVLNSGEIDEAVETLFREDGEPRDTITRKSRLDVQGGRVFLLGIIHDVTEMAQVNVALTSSQAKLEEQAVALAQLANTDPLTGCLNRNVLSSIDQELFQSTDAAASLLLLDLDHFKQLNDQFGHACGDAALQHFVTVIRHKLAPRFQFVRLGGEEFGVFTAGLSLSESESLANVIRESVADSTFRYLNSTVSFTVSIGISHKPEGQSRSLNLIMSAADEALYSAKNAGRNNVKLGLAA